MADLGDSIQRTRYIENTLRVSGNALRYHDSGATLLANFVDVRAAFANDNRSVLGDDKTPHLDMGRRRGGRG